MDWHKNKALGGGGDVIPFYLHRNTTAIVIETAGTVANPVFTDGAYPSYPMEKNTTKF